MPQITKHRGAHQQRGRLLRPLCLGRRGQPHDHRAGKGLPAALLLRCRLRQPHPALSDVSDQALRGALRRRASATKGLRQRLVDQAQGFPDRADLGRHPARAARRAMQAAPRRLSTSRARRSTATASGRSPTSSRTRTSTSRDRRCRRHRRAAGRPDRLASRSSSSGPGATTATGPTFPVARQEPGGAVEVLVRLRLPSSMTNKPRPSLVLLSHQASRISVLIAEALGQRAGRRVQACSGPSAAAKPQASRQRRAATPARR